MKKNELLNDEKLYCEYCGASMKEYWHTLTNGLVSGLVKFARGVREKRENKIHLRDDLWGPNELSRDELSNFTRLRFHGMVAKLKEKDENGDYIRIGHYWLLTRKGAAFLRGEIAVPKRVKTFRNEVIDHDDETVKLHDFKFDVIEFEQTFNFDIYQGKLL